jgi:hypothetical protein
VLIGIVAHRPPELRGQNDVVAPSLEGLADNLLRLALWEFPQEFFYLPVVPWWLQRAFMAPLALVGRRLGYSARAEPVKSNETAA